MIVIGMYELIALSHTTAIMHQSSKARKLALDLVPTWAWQPDPVRLPLKPDVSNSLFMTNISPLVYVILLLCLASIFEHDL